MTRSKLLVHGKLNYQMAVLRNKYEYPLKIFLNTVMMYAITIFSLYYVQGSCLVNNYYLDLCECLADRQTHISILC